MKGWHVLRVDGKLIGGFDERAVAFAVLLTCKLPLPYSITWTKL